MHRVDYETGKLDQWHHAYEYDADNRITDVFTSTETPITSINSSIASIQNEPVINPLWEQEAAYIYYDHGSLARTELGENKVQGLDYVYTLQGWIKSVNSNNLKNDPGNDGSPGQNNVTAKDAFGYSLHYFDNDYHSAINGQNSFITSQANSDMELNNSPLYNGNIARMVTTITNPTTREVLPLGNVYQYDQLNRLSNAQSYAMNSSTFTWSNGATPMYKNSFTYDANGNILTQNRANGANTVLDDLTYHYETFPNGDPRNRLAYVSDASSNTDPLELSNQSAANYSYDKEGRLISDAQEEIGVISWRVDGKVKKISRISGSQKKNVSFDYDAMGHRIAKHVYSSNDIWENSTFYVLDAQSLLRPVVGGNTLSTYSYEKDDSTQSISFAQTEKLCYGSARLGLNNEKVPLLASQNGNYSMQYVSHTVGNRLYELSNHLGNVLSVVSDKVIPFPNQNMTPGSYFLFFIPDIRQSTDYSPFGVTLQGRNFTANGTEKLRYGYQGSEMDNEVKGEGNSYTTEFRQLDPRLGRWLTLDPKSAKYPSESPYSSMGNNPIWLNDQLGDDYGISVIKDSETGKTKSVTIQATVYIKGDGANDKRAKILNKKAKDTYKSEVVDGVQVNIKVNYVYDPSKKPEDLQLGENLLTFKKGEGRSFVSPRSNQQTGNTGEITNSGKRDYSVLHETLHLLGFSDRYSDNSAGESVPHRGYENDIMGKSDKFSLKINHYKNLLNFVETEYTYMERRHATGPRYRFSSKYVDKYPNSLKP